MTSDQSQINIETRDHKVLRIIEMPSGDCYLGIFINENGALIEQASTPLPMERRDLVAEFLRL